MDGQSVSSSGSAGGENFIYLRQAPSVMISSDSYTEYIEEQRENNEKEKGERR